MLTRESILAMSPKELAEATATHVMGWIVISEREDLERRQTADYVSGRGIIALYGSRYIARSGGKSRNWNPGEDISAAIEVAEMFPTYQVTKMHDVVLPWSKEEMYRAIVKQNKNVAHAKTAPLAICRAALLTTIREDKE